MLTIARQFAAGALIYLMTIIPVFGQAAQLPNAKQQFFNINGNPVSAGTVDMFVPNTTSRKNTWLDSAQTQLNTNPIKLDAGGFAVIYGVGSYRQVLKDINGVTIFDGLTSAPGGGGGGGGGSGDGLAVGSVIPYYGMVPPIGYAFAFGQALSRTTFSILFNNLTISATATCSLGSDLIGGFVSTEQVRVGARIEANCLPPNTTVLVITSATSVQTSNVAITSVSTPARVFNYGNGDGATTFNVPDLRGRYQPGRDNMGGVAANRITPTFYGGVNPTAPGAAGGGQSTTIVTANLPAYTPAGTVGITDPGHGHTISPNPFTGAGAGPNLTGGTGSVNPVTANVNTTGITAAFTGAAQGGTSTAFTNLPPSVIANYIIKIEPNGGATVVNDINGMTGSLTCGPLILCGGSSIEGDINGLTTLVGPVDQTNDQLALYDASTGELRKVTPQALVSSTVAGVASIGGMTGVLLCGTNLTCSGNTISSTGLGNVLAFCGGVDDTAAIQSAVTTALATQQNVLVAGFFCPTTSVVTVNTSTASITIGGRGIQQTVILPQTVGQNVFNITGAGAVYLRDMAIQYGGNPSSGSAIEVNAASNSYSRFQNVNITNSWQGINFVRAGAWVIDGVNFQSFVPGRGCQVIIEDLTNPDNGGNVIANSNFIGGTPPSLTDMGICQNSQGDIRIVGNNFVNLAYGYDVNFRTTANSGQLVVNGNVFDGQTTRAIRFRTQDAAATSIFHTNVTGNVFRVETNGYGIEVAGSQNWFQIFTISGNAISVSGTGRGVSLDAGAIANISSNTISTGSATAIGIVASSIVSSLNIGTNNINGFAAGNQIQDASINKLGTVFNGMVGVGSVSTPSEFLDIRNNTTARLALAVYDAASAASGQQVFRRARGTQASPTAIMSGDRLGVLAFAGAFDTSGVWADSAAIIPVATQNFASGALGTALRIELAQIGASARTIVMQLDKPTTATFTGMMLWDVDNGTLERVTVGATDSGGAGFKVLRIPN